MPRIYIIVICLVGIVAMVGLDGMLFRVLVVCNILGGLWVLPVLLVVW